MFVTANNLTLNVDVRGAGDRLLILGGSGWDMRVQGDRLFELFSPFFEVCFFDQRGMGQSDKPESPYTIKDFADDAAGLLDALGWEKAHIVGYSFGGMVAQELAIGWPHRIERLVLAATSPGGRLGSSYPIETFLSLDPKTRARRSLEVADTRFSAGFQKDNPEIATAKIEKKMADQQKFSHEPGAAEGFANLLEARKHHDASDRLHKITAPTLILSGTHDGQASIEGQSAMKDHILGAEQKMIEGSHNFIFESEDCCKSIVEFLHDRPF